MRFYFRMRDGAGGLVDDEGVDLPGVTEAGAYAIEVAREVMKCDEVNKRPWAIEVLDENGGLVTSIPFVTIDPTLDHLDEASRSVVERMSATRRIASETMHRSISIVAQIGAKARRASRPPYLVTVNGQRV